MLCQADVVRLLAKEPPPEQHIAFSILHAYVFSKSRRGNLPSETLSKLLSIQRKLVVRRGGAPLPPTSSVARAMEAMRTQLLAVNKKWHLDGPRAFGPLGALGSTGGHPDAHWAWVQATDKKITSFAAGDGASAVGWTPLALDAGQVIGPGFTDSADPGRPAFATNDSGLPGYEPPSPPRVAQDEGVVRALNERVVEDAANDGTRAGREGRGSTDDEDGGTARGRSPEEEQPRNSIEAGVSELARLRMLKDEMERRKESESSSSPPATGASVAVPN
ncbi:SPOSA6832_00553 [Sporobolomyces salmonicolor]|uniref:SPOSA6832_00553-mRNA-1:cds n=1 Tax=Sporidiobolus salmonicolor TaxID=5005 RepID=A0A0D6EGX5_SPOSA|nr:SPOSA6832_00553 [Sporobolomyces salmonicolor]